MLLLALLACTPSPGGSTPVDPATDTAVPTARLTGSVSGPDGEPVGDLLVQVCSASLCYPAPTDGDGAFAVPALPLGPWSVKLAASPLGHSPAVVPLTLTADRTLDLVLPLLEPEVTVPAAPESHAVAPGLTLVLSTDQVPGVPAVAAGRIGTLPPADGLDATPLAGFYLAPLGAGVDVPFTATVPGARAAWCTTRDAEGWVRCDQAVTGDAVSGTLPRFGTLLLTD